MIIKELQLLSEALWESVKTDPKLFSPIQSIVKRLADYDYSRIEKEDTKELFLIGQKIEEYFDKFRMKPGSGLYFPPILISNNDDTVKRIFELITKLQILSSDGLAKEKERIKTVSKDMSKGEGGIFLGHGRSKLWARVQLHLKDELNLKVFSYESESHTSQSIIPVLESFLIKASFAILILTAEDETAEGKLQARQNVIHEAGLFQGRLGFDKVVLLKQDKTEGFSNIAGLQYIQFSDENVEQTFYELSRVLKKNGLLNP